MNRNWIKASYATALCRTGMSSLIDSVGGRRNAPIVVGYHRVVEDFLYSTETSIPSLLVTERMLGEQLDWIGRRYRFVGLDELGARLESGANDGDPIAAVTFDDGYRDFHDLAVPLLQKKGIPAAVFVVSDLVDTHLVQAHDRLYLLLKRRYRKTGETGYNLPPMRCRVPIPSIDGNAPYYATRILIEALPLDALQQFMDALESQDPLSDGCLRHCYSVTWDMLARIQSLGFTVGSHTRTHVLMANENESRMRDEALGSRLEIEKRLGAPVRHFCYPSGVYNTLAVRAVAAAGYRFGYTTCGHQSEEYPRLTVPRTLLWQNSSVDSHNRLSGAILKCQLQRAFYLAGDCRQRHTVDRNAAEGTFSAAA